MKIGDFADIEVQDFVAEGQSKPITLTNVPHPANTSLAVARATRGRVNAFELEIDNAGKNGHSAPFSWSG